MNRKVLIVLQIILLICKHELNSSIMKVLIDRLIGNKGLLHTQTDLELAAVYAIYRSCAFSSSASLHHTKFYVFTRKELTYLLVTHPRY